MRYAIPAAWLVVCATLWFGSARETENYPAFTEADIAGFLRERQQHSHAAPGRPHALRGASGVEMKPRATTITTLAFRPAASTLQSAGNVPRRSRD
jgi:hypothetical protein